MKKTLAIIGCGFLGNIIADACKNGLLNGYTLIRAYSKTHENAVKLTESAGGTACRSIDELLTLKPDFLAETASVQTVKDCAVKALLQGTSLIPLSIGAFADKEFLKEVKSAAQSGFSNRILLKELVFMIHNTIFIYCKLRLIEQVYDT